LTKAEAQKWCQTHGAALGLGGFPDPKGETNSFAIPTDAGERVALVAEHLKAFANGTTLVWFDDWSVWPSAQRMHIFERFRASYGETRPLIEAPAFLFADQEYEDLVSFVTLGVLFLWDVHLVGANDARQLVYSHDEVGWIDA
jgi:hypothetical protein